MLEKNWLRSLASRLPSIRLSEQATFSVLVLIFVTSLLYFLRWDLPASQWDEMQVYLGSAVNGYSAMNLDAQWSPLYILWYFFLHAIFPGTSAELLVFNQCLITCLALLSWYFFLRALKWPGAVAALVLIAVASHPLIWESDIRAHHFSLCCVATIGILLLRIKNRQWQLCILAASLIPLVLTRPELLSLYPACLVIYLFCRPWKVAGANFKPPIYFFSILALSFAFLCALGIFSGRKSGETYFKKQWERHVEQGDHRYPTEIEYKKDYFPRSTNFLSAVFENHQEVVTHSLYHLRLFCHYAWWFFTELPLMNLALARLFLFAIAAGLAYLAWRPQALKLTQIPLTPAAASFFLILWPFFFLAIIYGTLSRYNIAAIFVLFSVSSIPILALPKKIQSALAFSAFLFFAVHAAAWKEVVLGRTPMGLWQHYISFSREFSEAIPISDARILTNCGTIWNLVSSNITHSQNFRFMFFSNPFGDSPPRTVIKNFDVVIFCKKNTSVPLGEEGISLYEKEISKMKKDFTRLIFQPADAAVYVSNRILIKSPLPQGVTF